MMKANNLTVDAIADRGEDTFLSFFRRYFRIELPEFNPWNALGVFIQEYLGNNLDIRRRQQEAHLFFTALSGQEDPGNNAEPCHFFSLMRPTIRTTLERIRCEQCASYQGKTLI